MFLSEIFRDKEYLRKLTVVAFPLILQQVITYSVNLLDTMMIGSFGDIPLAAVNLVNQFYLIYSVSIFGSVTGGSILNAQYWGKRDKKSIHHVMGIQFLFAMLIGSCFLVVSILFPHKILGFYSDDEAVADAGKLYLQIILPVFLLFPVGQIFSGALRCTENTGIPMLVSGGTLLLNAILNYLLIFGKFGLPALGLAGAAAATVIARAVETTVFILITYCKKLPPAAPLSEMFHFNRPLVLMVIRKGIPVIVNEMIWGLGVNAYTAVYAGISTASIAAFSAVSPVDNIAQSLFMGIGDGCAVMVGNLLGAGKIETAKNYAKKTIRLSLCAALLVGSLLVVLHQPIISLYALSDTAAQLAGTLLVVVGFTLWLRTSNYTIIIGTLRPGGQSLYCLLIETIVMWLLGIPLAGFMAERLHLPVYLVYLGTVTEEASKLVVFFKRYKSGIWAVNLIEGTDA
ncbi:MAG: MATE family efflux transporter [Anaerolineaceae bacterium]|nr:MATE family efflux transporter [Anaerolineaceae bacterium]